MLQCTLSAARQVDTSSYQGEMSSWLCHLNLCLHFLFHFIVLHDVHNYFPQYYM